MINPKILIGIVVLLLYFALVGGYLGGSSDELGVPSVDDIVTYRYSCNVPISGHYLSPDFSIGQIYCTQKDKLVSFLLCGTGTAGIFRDEGNVRVYDSQDNIIGQFKVDQPYAATIEYEVGICTAEKTALFTAYGDKGHVVDTKFIQLK